MLRQRPPLLDQEADALVQRKPAEIGCAWLALGRYHAAIWNRRDQFERLWQRGNDRAAPTPPEIAAKGLFDRAAHGDDAVKAGMDQAARIDHAQRVAAHHLEKDAP